MSNRSGSPYGVPRDSNRVPFLVAASTSDGVTPVVLEADPTTHALVTSGSGGGGGSATVVGIGPVGFNSSPYDSVAYTATSGTVDTYVYTAGGLAGTTKATVTITYTDSTHGTLVSVVRT
jgi:hypothetical protein